MRSLLGLWLIVLLSIAASTCSYAHDGDQLALSQVSDQATGASSASTLATYGYDAVGNLSGLTRGNSVATAYTYDELNRLRLMVNTRGTSELSRFAYTVRDDGKRTGLNETLANNTAVTPSALPVTTRGVTYGYDNAGRLTGEIGNDGRAVNYENVWSYDKVGNRVSTTERKATVANPTTFSSTTTISSTFNANDWLTSQSSSTNGGAASTQSWSYDLNGAEKTHAYGATSAQENGWGFDGTLLGTGTQGTTSGGTSYTTDASGNRIAVTLNQGEAAQKTSKYLLDENTSYAQVLEERAPDVNDSGTSVLQARMVWGGGLAPLAMWRKMPDSSVKLFYFVTDGQESVRQLTDSAGLVTDSYYYDAWGTALAGGSGDTKNSFRYTGQMLDASGKYFLRARYYDPSTARFLSHDPVMGSESDPISLHRYLYAGADGVNGSDPSGEETLANVMTSIGVNSTLASVLSTSLTVGNWIGTLVSAGNIYMDYQATKSLNLADTGLLLASVTGPLWQKWLFGALAKAGTAMSNLYRSGALNKFVFEKIGDVYLKQVNPGALKLIQRLAQSDLNRQVKALDDLGDMAPTYQRLNEGTILIKDVGAFSGTRWQAFKIWWKGSLRMKNPLNDIRPHNIGDNGQIFDPALPLYQQWFYGTSVATLVGGAGYTAYLMHSTDAGEDE